MEGSGPSRPGAERGTRGPMLVLAAAIVVAYVAYAFVFYEVVVAIF